MKKYLSILFLCISSYITAQDWVWVQQGTNITGEASDDNFGNVVSINSAGNVIAVGAVLNDGNGIDAGHIRVYEWDGTAWVQRGNDLDGEAAGDLSGSSVSLNNSGDVIAVGAPNNDAAASNAGHVRVYEWDGTTWVQRGNDLDGNTMDDQAGHVVSLNGDGNILALGTPNSDNGSVADVGHVSIYEWNGATWTQLGNDIMGEALSDYSGGHISINNAGHTVIIGAHNNDGNGTDAGHARVYDWDGTTWVQRGNDIDGDMADDEAGYSTAISDDGNTIAIGVRNGDGTTLANTGYVRVYDWDGTTWVQRGNNIEGERSDDQAGSSISLNANGNILVMASPFNDGIENLGAGYGQVRIYEWNVDSTAWLQRGNTLYGEFSSDFMGKLAMNSSGDTIVVGLGAINERAQVFYYCQNTYALTPIDTAVCDTFISPSGKYVLTSAGTYSDTIPNAAGCDSILTINLTIKPPIFPSIANGLGQDTLVVEQDTTVFFSTNTTGGDFYAWYLNNGSYTWFAASATALTTGTSYPNLGAHPAILEVEANGCIYADTLIVLVIEKIVVSSEKKEDMLSSINIYPNPSKNYVQIQTSIYGEDVFLRLVDPQGRILRTEKLNSTEQQLDIETLNSGIYYLQIFDQKELLFLEKIIKL